ncbi:MAG: DUF3450 domain-containing protein [Planctomycetes bacterium]|nr:DUF3450 domain-containing protein [Planctomycetota bacterium]
MKAVLFAGVIALAAFFPALPALAGEEPPAPSAEDDAVQLEKSLAELRQTREERYRLEAAHRLEMRTLELRLAELEAGAKTLEPRTEALGRESAEAAKALEAARAELGLREAASREAGGALDRAAARLRGIVGDSIPFRVPERLRAVDEALASPSAAPAAPGAPAPEDPVAARVRRFHLVLDAEIALGSSTEAYLDRVELGPDQRPRARCLRLGMIELAFLTEDGTRSGLLVWDSSASKYAWKTDLSFRERWGLKRGLEILERRRPPVFLDFPMDLGRVSAAPAAPGPQGGKEGR